MWLIYINIFLWIYLNGYSKVMLYIYIGVIIYFTKHYILIINSLWVFNTWTIIAIEQLNQLYIIYLIIMVESIMCYNDLNKKNWSSPQCIELYNVFIYWKSSYSGLYYLFINFCYSHWSNKCIILIETQEHYIAIY